PRTSSMPVVTKTYVKVTLMEFQKKESRKILKKLSTPLKGG
ncbi:unnamed protein product, partial [marine sediment metagenome]